MRAVETGTSEVASWLDHGRVPCLDGLRAVSIAIVLMAHASLARGFPFALGHWLGKAGVIGVSMFFAISGFLITMLLVREWNRTQTISTRGFYRRRALRILPAYIVFVAAVALLQATGAFALNRTDWLGTLTYTVNFIEAPTWEIGHIWSLSVEEQFYLGWPVIMLLLSPARARWVLIGYLLLAPMLRFIIWAFFRQHLSIIDDLTLLRLDSIAAGCLLALIVSHRVWRGRLLPSPSQAVRATAAAAIFIGCSYGLSYYITVYRLTFSYSFEAAAMIVIIWSSANAAATWLGRLLEMRVMTAIGLLSYSLYLWQQLFLNPHRLHTVTSWPYNILLVSVAAGLSYVLVERPFLRLKDRSSPRAAVSAGVSQPEGETAVSALVQRV